jgi:hypothetical protein
MEVHDYGCVGQIEVPSNTSQPAWGQNQAFDDDYSEAKKRNTRSVLVTGDRQL